MTWTTTRPTEPAWYWFRYAATSAPFPVIVWKDSRTLMVEGIEDRRTCLTKTVYCLLEHLVGEWAGPLQPPH